MSHTEHQKESFEQYLDRKRVTDLMDTLFESLAATSSSSSQQQANGGSDAALKFASLTSRAIATRTALLDKQCIPADALNNSKGSTSLGGYANSTVAVVRHLMGGKKILVVAEVPLRTAADRTAGRSAGAGVGLGLSALEIMRLELVVRTIKSIATLGATAPASTSRSGGGGGAPVPPKMALALLFSDADGEHERHNDDDTGIDVDAARRGHAKGGRLRHPTAVTLDDINDVVRELEADDLLAEGRDTELERPMTSDAASKPTSPPTTAAAQDGDGGGEEGVGLRGALAALVTMLWREGIDIELFRSHTELLEPSVIRSVDPFESMQSTGMPLGARPTVFVLPSVWSDPSLANPLSVLDPIFTFADTVVVEGLEMFRHKDHPLVRHIPRALGQAALGAGAAQELRALRNLFAPAFDVTSSSSSSRGVAPSGRVLILGDDERGVEWSSLTPPVPEDRTKVPSGPPPALSLPSALLHFVPHGAEVLVYAFDEIIVTGTAALIAPNVAYRRAQMKRQMASEEGLTSVPPFSLPWSTALEAAVCGLMDAAEHFSAAMPRGCKLTFAEDFAFAKMTTSGKTKVEVVRAAAWCRLDAPPPLDPDLELPSGRQLLEQSAPGGGRLFLVDVGPSTRARVLKTLQQASFVCFCGAVTRSLVHSTEGASRIVRPGDPDFTGVEDPALRCAAAEWLRSVPPSSPAVLLGEQWLQTASTTLYGLKLPLPEWEGGPPVDMLYTRSTTADSQPPNPSQGLSSSSAGGPPPSSSVLASRRHQSLTPLSHPSTPQIGKRTQSPNRSPTGRGAGGHSPLSSTISRSASIAPPSQQMGATRGGGGIRILQGRYQGDRSAVGETWHVSTLSYPQVATLLCGEPWTALQELPYPVESRHN